MSGVNEVAPRADDVEIDEMTFDCMSLKPAPDTEINVVAVLFATTSSILSLLRSEVERTIDKILELAELLGIDDPESVSELVALAALSWIVNDAPLNVDDFTVSVKVKVMTPVFMLRAKDES